MSKNDLSESEKTALLLLREHGGVGVGKIPDTAEGLKPGLRVMTGLIRKGLVYRADGWTPKGGGWQGSTYELTYDGSVKARELSEQHRKLAAVRKIKLSVLREEDREVDPFEEEQAYER